MSSLDQHRDVVELVHEFRHRRVLVVGDALLDVYLDRWGRATVP